MKKLEEIKILFENRSYSVRSDFINDYDFNDDYYEYYHQFLLNAESIKDRFYLSDLIDLTGWLDIYDMKIMERYYSYLFSQNHYLIKLAVLDYFKYCNKDLPFPSYEKDLNAILQERLPSILRCQVLINLLILDTKDAPQYIKSLISLLEHNNDWKVIHRLLNNLKEVQLRLEYSSCICKELVKKSQIVELGASTKSLPIDVCKNIHE
ncbi:hypothetical protein HHL17_14455 [Chitinophaga sp. G-6-1-13]|uniref:HEAT repeat domain-containing protein n=1 Tax=Chitinophaga fulva TaxID=2728842 RepID=A0A848GJG9_9BACT|nr:hypothetical protein [Chitinophaga fulva]NML38406.1 hypothetical protein [Chitinophaga fulva]